MDWDDGSDDRTGLKVATMLIVGLVSLVIIIALSYFSVEAAIGRMDFCTLWTDIPGRIAIFTIGYYIAGICGYLPIPERFLLNFLPMPLMLWKLETWREILRIPLFTNFMNEEDSSGLPFVQQPNEERYYDCLPTTIRHSEPTPIIFPENPVAPALNRPPNSPRKESPNTSVRSDESFMSFDSPIAGFIVPMVKGKSSKPRYLTDSDKSSSGSTTDQSKVPKKRIETIDEQTEASSEQKAGAKDQAEKPDTPPRTADDENQLPNYPRFPWGLFRHPGGVPRIARNIHMRNLRIERREAEKYARKQKASAQSSAKNTEPTTDKRDKTESGEDSASKRQSFRLPSQRPGRGRSRRARTTVESLDKLRPMKLRTRGYSDSSDQSIQSVAGPSRATQSEQTDKGAKPKKMLRCCEKSPDLHSKVERIKAVFARMEQNLRTERAGASGSSPNQNVNVESSKEVEGKRSKDTSERATGSTRQEAIKKPNNETSIGSQKPKSGEDDPSSSPKEDRNEANF